jgi:excisionase family DNA binding protein
MAIDREFLTVKEVSDLLRVHRSTVYKLIKEGKIPGFWIGSEFRIRTDQLVRWIAEQWAASVSEKSHREEPMFKCPVDQKEIDPERERYECFIVEGRTCRSVQVKDCKADDKPVLVHATCADRFRQQVASGNYSTSN